MVRSATPPSWRSAAGCCTTRLHCRTAISGDVPGAGRAYQAAAIGMTAVPPVRGGAIYGRRILVDNTCGPGILLANMFNLEVDVIQGYQNLGPAIECSPFRNLPSARQKQWELSALSTHRPRQTGSL